MYYYSRLAKKQIVSISIASSTRFGYFNIVHQWMIFPQPHQPYIKYIIYIALSSKSTFKSSVFKVRLNEQEKKTEVNNK